MKLRMKLGRLNFIQTRPQADTLVQEGPNPSTMQGVVVHPLGKLSCLVPPACSLGSLHGLVGSCSDDHRQNSSRSQPRKAKHYLRHVAVLHRLASMHGRTQSSGDWRASAIALAKRSNRSPKSKFTEDARKGLSQHPTDVGLNMTRSKTLHWTARSRLSRVYGPAHVGLRLIA